MSLETGPGPASTTDPTPGPTPPNVKARGGLLSDVTVLALLVMVLMVGVAVLARVLGVGADSRDSLAAVAQDCKVPMPDPNVLVLDRSGHTLGGEPLHYATYECVLDGIGAPAGTLINIQATPRGALNIHGYLVSWFVDYSTNGHVVEVTANHGTGDQS